ncbi:hypothetical protein [Streptomyces heilongjiangensis]|uniref:Uncharacterized protein n=1 Tax=Streptomyces heilongjiangensis TaxID=945052 RepID=A0ABW1BHF9_9ACTN
MRDRAVSLILTGNASVWLAALIARPSLDLALTCLSAYGAALAFLALVLAARRETRQGKKPSS